MNELLVAMIAFLSGLAAPALNTWFSHLLGRRLDLNSRQLETINLRKSIGSEIAAILRVADRRGWLHEIESYATRIREKGVGYDLELAKKYPQKAEREQQEHFEITQIFRANRNRIGEIGEYAPEVVKFYVELAAINSALRDLTSEAFLSEWDADVVASQLEDELKALRENLQLGLSLLDKLN